MKDQYYEELLNIKTTGEKLWDTSITHYHPYQATDYYALELLFKFYSLDISDNIVDFGCGKGRLIFYINHFFKCKAIGVEMDKDLYKNCLLNKEDYLSTHKIKNTDIDFICELAQNYNIKETENKFYFFNPFSIQIFRSIIKNILKSLEQYPRKVQLILYYPSDDYVYFLDNNTSFVLVDEVFLNEMYLKDSNERFLIYELDYSYFI